MGNATSSFMGKTGRVGVVGRTKTKMGRKTEMAATAGNRRKGSDAFLVFLQENPSDARVLGKALKRSRVRFAKAFPGETRVETFSNEEWREGGFDYVADVNLAMGLKRS